MTRLAVCLAAVLAALATGCAEAHSAQSLVVFNQTDGPQRISIRLDGQTLYSGLLGTVDYAPAIVINQTLWLERGSHTFCVDVPGQSLSKCIPVTVAKQSVNMIVMVDQGKVDMDVHYGAIAYM